MVRCELWQPFNPQSNTLPTEPLCSTLDIYITIHICNIFFQIVLRNSEHPPIMKGTSWTLAAPFKEQKYHRTPSESIANNYTPSASDLKLKDLPKLSRGRTRSKSTVNVLKLCLPPLGSGDILFFPRGVRLSVRPSVCLSVHLSVCHKSCPLYNLKTP